MTILVPLVPSIARLLLAKARLVYILRLRSPLLPSCSSKAALLPLPNENGILRP